MTTERNNLLASIAGTIKDYRAGEIAEPTPAHVDRWISQFDDVVQIPMLRELDSVFKRTYVSMPRMQQFLAGVADSFPCEFWQAAHILSIQQNGGSQAEIRELFGHVLRERCGATVEYTGSADGDFVYLDDAIFTGERVLYDLRTWFQYQAPAKANLHIMVIAVHTLGSYWIEKNLESSKSGKQIAVTTWRGSTFENRLVYRNQSDVLWPTDGIYPDGGFQPRQPGYKGPIFASEQGRQLLEREFLTAGLKIRGFANKPSPALKPLGFSQFRFSPGFGSLLVTYRNCPNNCPLALWYGDPSYPDHHPLSKWYPLFPRKTYEVGRLL